VSLSPEIIRWIKIVVLRTLKEKNLTRLDVSTLVSAGMLGYVQTLKRFDPGRGVKFKTFAEYRIKGAVLDEVRKMIGDERCKNKRPRRIDDFDYTMISDDGHQATTIESYLDLEGFFKHVPLSEREVDILKCRYFGMNLREISGRFGFSESRASQLLAKIKKVVYVWYRDEQGVDFKITEMKCPSCKGYSIVTANVSEFRCDCCDVKLMIVQGNPIPSQDKPEIDLLHEDLFDEGNHAATI
jgi:RNA polymerase sigma factor (sigma-70 family)